MEKKSKNAKPIKKIAVILTPFEAAVVGKLRDFDFGELIIKKKDGAPYQVITSKSSMVRYEEGLNLPGSFGLTEEMVGGKVDLNKLFVNSEKDD